MGTSRHPRVCERRFLNLPGFHGGAYILAYVEDTTGLGPRRERRCSDDCPDCPHNFEPRTTLQIADCNDRIDLEFGLDTEDERVNALHKVDSLIDALSAFRAGLEEEFVEYDRRERELA
jgi:hypothetical protein